MVTKLIVKNFGPIKGVELELTKNMVFIGPQSSGKSTLAKLIAICIDMEMDRTRGSAYFSESLDFYNMHSYVKEDTSIAFLFKNGEEYFFTKKDLFCLDGNGVERTNTVTYIPSERSILPILNRSIMGLLLSGVPIPKNILFFGGEFEKARDINRIIDVPLFNVKFIYEDGQNKLVLTDGKKIELSEASSGFQSVLPMLLVVKNAKNRSYHSLVVEEPEQNLYPQSQKDVSYYLADQSSSLSRLFCITTHSPYVLTSLNNCLKAYTVGQRRSKKVENIIKKESWLNPHDFSAYYVGDGGKIPIFNKEVGLIDEEYLDSVSDEIMGDFQELLDIS